MRATPLLAIIPLLIASGFPPDKYELAAAFTGALVRGDLDAAQRMMTRDAKLMEWNDGPHALRDIASYLRRCPLKSIEGVQESNINIMLDCPQGYHSVSLMFSGARISEVDFGPPPVIRTSTPVEKPNG